MDDIVTRLRTHLVEPSRTHWDGCIDTHPLCALAWALDEIERLRSENRGLHLDLMIAYSEAAGMYDEYTL